MFDQNLFFLKKIFSNPFNPQKWVQHPRPSDFLLLIFVALYLHDKLGKELITGTFCRGLNSAMGVNKKLGFLKNVFIHIGVLGYLGVHINPKYGPLPKSYF